MTTHETNKKEAKASLDQAVVNAMNAAHKAGLNHEDLKAYFERWVNILTISE